MGMDKRSIVINVVPMLLFSDSQVTLWIDISPKI